MSDEMCQFWWKTVISSPTSGGACFQLKNTNFGTKLKCASFSITSATESSNSCLLRLPAKESSTYKVERTLRARGEVRVGNTKKWFLICTHFCRIFRTSTLIYYSEYGKLCFLLSYSVILLELPFTLTFWGTMYHLQYLKLTSNLAGSASLRFQTY